MYLYAKNPYEAKYQFLINKAFIKYSNDIDDIYKNIRKTTPQKK